jgi:hypothetical protein
MKHPGATSSVTRDRRPALRPHWLLLLACVVPLLFLLTGCDASTYTPPDPNSTVVDTSLSTTTAEPATTTTGVETTTTTVAPVTTASSTTTTFAPATTTTQTVATPGTVLYDIHDWSGASGWALTGQWKTVTGLLVTDGSENSIAVAPYDPGVRSDYAVEAEIQAIDPRAVSCYLEARLINGEGYWGGYTGGSWDSDCYMRLGFGSNQVANSGQFIVNGDWHLYRLEVSGNSIRLLFDGSEVVRAMDNRQLEPGTVGIFCDGQVNIRAFRVIAL